MKIFQILKFPNFPDYENAEERARNQKNRFDTSTNELLKTFGGFQVFEYALWQ